jgi:type VI secretion system protein ImpF
VIVFSLLHRLSEAVENVPQDEKRRRQRGLVVTEEDFRRYRASVRGDLEWLLNTRMIDDDLHAGIREVEESVYCYGLPDFSQMDLHPATNEMDQDHLAAMIKRAIDIFEPRLVEVDVSIAGRPSGGSELRFQISGKLRMEPRPEPVAYDTTLELTRGDYAVKVAGEAA